MTDDTLQATAATILVIDDDLPFLDLAAEVLEDDGYQVLLCQDVIAGVSLLEQEPVDLVILDLHFNTPESGWDVVDYLRTHSVLRTIPVIVCSAAIGARQAEGQALRTQGITVLSKPFDIDALSCLVDKTLGNRVDHGWCV